MIHFSILMSYLSLKAYIPMDRRRAQPFAEHGEKVDHRIGAPADHSHDLGSLDLALDHRVSLAVCGSSQANQELVDNVEEEAHGHKPAEPARSKVTSDDQLAVVARD